MGRTNRKGRGWQLLKQANFIASLPKGKGQMTTATITKPEPTTTAAPDGAAAPSSGFTDFILRRLRVEALRAKIVTNEIETTATALSGGMITAEDAVLFLAETGLEPEVSS